MHYETSHRCVVHLTSPCGSGFGCSSASHVHHFPFFSCSSFPQCMQLVMSRAPTGASHRPVTSQTNSSSSSMANPSWQILKREYSYAEKSRENLLGLGKFSVKHLLGFSGDLRLVGSRHSPKLLEVPFLHPFLLTPLQVIK